MYLKQMFKSIIQYIFNIILNTSSYMCVHIFEYTHSKINNNIYNVNKNWYIKVSYINYWTDPPQILDFFTYFNPFYRIILSDKQFTFHPV